MIQQVGRLHVAEVAGKVYVATAKNFEWLQAFVEEGREVHLVEGVDKSSGRPWTWVNPPWEKNKDGNRKPKFNGPKANGNHAPVPDTMEPRLRGIEKQLEEVLFILRGANVEG